MTSTDSTDDHRDPRIKLSTKSYTVALVAALCLLASNTRISSQGAISAPLTLPEGVPDFSQDTVHPTILSAQSGSWASAATWQGGQIPSNNNMVRIGAGHTVTIDNTAAVAYTVAIDGTLAFAPTANTRLNVTNLEVLAGNNGMGTPGVLEVGTATAPIAATVTAEIVVANSPYGVGVADPDQFGTGIIAFGKVRMHGSVKTPTFVRMGTEPRAGQTTLTLSQAVSGWTVGDRLVLPDTRHIKETDTTGSGWINAVNQWEERTLQAVSADGRTLTLNSALQYDHLGARDLTGALNFLPHVGNLTRNVIVRSESASGTRGHILATHMADVDIRYGVFKDLGRTTYLPLNTTSNHIGRYPLHMHHLSGPTATPANGYQFTLVGNAVDGGSAETKFKWGVTVHGTHYGLIQDNVVYNYNGASVATEDGSESFNLFDHNFALRGIGQPNDSVSEARMAMGTEGVGFWFRGPNNYVRNNVAANFQNPTTEAAYGFAFQFRYLGDINIPNFKGADTTGMMGPGQWTTRNGNNMPILQFENNEAYGATQGGLTFWWVSALDPPPYAGAAESVIKDFKVWHVDNKGVYGYPANKITFDGLIIRGNFTATSRCCGNGLYFADYSSNALVIRNADIQGMQTGIIAPMSGYGPQANLTIQDSYLRNWENLNNPIPGSVNGCWMENKLVVATNTRFDTPPGRTANHLEMVGDVANVSYQCLTKLNELRIYAYQGVATDNFQVYSTNSTYLPRPPGSCTPTTRPGIIGAVVCPIAALGPVAPSATLSASPSVIRPGQSATLTWTTSNATTVSINQGGGAVPASGSGPVSPAATTTYTLTATNAVGSTTATATVTVDAAAPAISGVSSSGLTANTATVSFSTNEPSYHQVEYGLTTAYGGTTALDSMLMTTHSQALTGLTASTLYHYRVRASDAAGNTATSGDFTFTTTAVTVSGNNAARANSYDDAWQNGTSGWVANAKAILAAGSGQTPGLVLWIGDSLTRDPALGAWAQRGAGKTAEDQAITTWMHAGLSPQSIDSIDGFALATPYICSARSYTVGDGLGSWDFMGGSGMPPDTNPTTARQKLQNCTAYSNALDLTTILSAIPKAQFAIPEVNLDAARPGVFPDFQRMVDLLISKGIVPIIITYTYRTDAAFNLLVDQYNAALVQYAQTKKLPLIDLQNEMLARLPFSQWPGRLLSDGVHYTSGSTQYPSTADPYAVGGDPSTHTTGAALTYDGYGLKGWLGVQKMKEIKQLVVDGTTPPPTCSFTLSATSVTGGAGAAGASVTVTPSPSSCTWTATSNATWITITAGASGTGNGTVSFSVSANAGPARTGTMTIAGQTFTVTQAAAAAVPCTFTLSASSAAVGAAATSGSATFTASASTCAWTATSNAAWITITAGASGSGNGTVSISVAANAGTSARTGTLTIAGLTFTVVQSGATPSCTTTITPITQAVGMNGGSATVNVTAVAGCGWSATSAATWISVTSGASGAGNGSVTLQVPANTGAASRSGTINIAGQVATLSQPGTSALSSTIVDFNGDGIADTFSYDPATGNFTETITGQGPVTGTGPAGLAIQLTDLDGDGLTDVFGYNAANGSWVKGLNTGRGDFTITSGTWWPGSQAYVLDLEGRGQASVFFDTGAGLLMPLATGAPTDPRTRPWLSADRLRLYFGSTRESGGSRLDLFVVTRATVTGDFGTPAAIGELNVASANSTDPSLTSDELTVFFASDRSGGNFDLWVASRTSSTARFSAPQPLTSVNSGYRDAHVAAAPNGRTLYFESDRPGGVGGPDIWVATRETADAPFGPPVAFSIINSAGADSYPVLTADTRELYFSSDRPGGAATGNMWRARLYCDAVVGGPSTFASSGGSGSITITDASGCAWVATSTQSWITVTSAASGSGSAVITYAVAANAGGARTGTLTVGGQSVTVSESPSTSSPGPAPSPAPGPTPSPGPSPSPTPGPGPSPSPGPSPTPSPGPLPTPTPPPVGSVPLAPRNLASRVTGSTVVFTWDPPASGPASTRYLLDAGSYRGGNNIVADYSLESGQPSFTAVGVAPGIYAVRVRAANAAGVGPASNEVVVVVVGGACGGPPTPPRGLTYSVQGSTVTLTWEPSEGSMPTYIVEAGSVPRGSDITSSDTGSSFTRLSVDGVPRGIYHVRVHARNACGRSGASNEIAVIVP